MITCSRCKHRRDYRDIVQVKNLPVCMNCLTSKELNPSDIDKVRYLLGSDTQRQLLKDEYLRLGEAEISHHSPDWQEGFMFGVNFINQFNQENLSIDLVNKE